jgi:hypothetical protein
LIVSYTGSDGVFVQVVSDVVDERQSVVVYFVVVAEQLITETDVVVATFFDVYEWEWCAVGTTGIGDAGVGQQQLIAYFAAKVALQFTRY